MKWMEIKVKLMKWSKMNFKLENVEKNILEIYVGIILIFIYLVVH